MNHLELNHKLEKLTIVEVGLDILRDRIKKRPISRDYRGLCPFHVEKHPSFYLRAQWNRYACFGCGVSGSHLEFPFAFFGGRICERENPGMDYLEKKLGFNRRSPFSLAVLLAHFEVSERMHLAYPFDWRRQTNLPELFFQALDREYHDEAFHDEYSFGNQVSALSQFALKNPNATKKDVTAVLSEFENSKQLVEALRR